MTDRKILIIEDSPDIAQLLRIHLEDLGLGTVWESDGKQGLARAQAEVFELIVLDLMLPSLSGLEICRALRSDASRYVPILMLTAKASEIDRVVGLEIGADDYLGKPFSIPELQARAKALLRRAERMKTPAPILAQSQYKADPYLRTGALRICPAKRELTLEGVPVALTAKEFDLLHHFLQQPGRVFSRSQLLDAVWGTTLESYEHNVNTTINRLRAKIEADPANPRYVLTVRGVGYKLGEQS
jgi:two-component system, OmpR family, response regulator